MEPIETPESQDPWELLAATPAWCTPRYLSQLGRAHASLARPALEYLAALGPLEFKTLRAEALPAALRYLEIARVVYDLADPEQGFEVFAYLTERIELPDAAELVERVAALD